MFYYVCDACGNLTTITDAAIPEGEAWECDACGSSAVWEFTSRANALRHSQHIRHALASGLFRKGASS